MAKAKPIPKCGMPRGHAAAADARVQAIHAEVKRVGDQYARLLVERGPRCQHTIEGPDARNVRLIETHALVVRKLNERIKELEAVIEGTLRPKGRVRKGGEAPAPRPVAPASVLPF